MSDRGSHITMRLQDDWVIAPDISARRIAARVFLKLGQAAGLLAFDVPDNHAHAQVLCDRTAAGRFAQAVQTALRKRLHLPVPFERSRIRPITGQQHLKSCFDYILRNTTRHGAQGDPLREGSNLPDLLGLRTLGAYTRSTVRRVLPRTDRADLLKHYGLEQLEAGTDVRLIVSAAAAAAAVAHLNARSPAVMLAKRAAVQAGRQLGMKTAHLADQLAMTQRGVQKLAIQPVDPALVAAVLLQIGLREQLAARTNLA